MWYGINTPSDDSPKVHPMLRTISILTRAIAAGIISGIIVYGGITLGLIALFQAGFGILAGMIIAAIVTTVAFVLYHLRQRSIVRAAQHIGSDSSC